MKNVHVLPTDKSSRLIMYSKKLGTFRLLDETCDDWKGRLNIYITSDKLPKLDEWGINTKNNVIYKDKGFVPKKYEKVYCKKIILTTDQDLIKDGVQAISDEFLEWYVKNPSCEDIEVKIDCDICALECTTNKCPNLFYKIIIPKEEPKQETLEEVAEIWVNNRFTKQIKDEDIYASKSSIIESHILFAKWQQERSYSDEDMIEFSKFCQTDEFECRSVNKSLLELFEHFKKK